MHVLYKSWISQQQWPILWLWAGLGQDLPSPSWRSCGLAAPGCAGSRPQPPPSAEPAARHWSTAAPLDRKWVNTWPLLLQHPFTIIWLSATEPNFLAWNREVCGHREVHYFQSPEWNSFGVWVMLQPPRNSGGSLAAAGEPRTTGSLSTSLHPPLLQRACFFPHLMNI